jgi:hypothetical protein
MAEIILTYSALAVLVSLALLVSTCFLIAALWCWREWARSLRPEPEPAGLEVLAHD